MQFVCLADNSDEMPSLIFSENDKTKNIMLSATILLNALRVSKQEFFNMLEVKPKQLFAGKKYGE